MSWCSVLGCQEVKSSVRKGHSFPGVDEKELRECWIKFCGQQPDWNPNKQAKICGAHFNDSDFGLDVKGNIKKKLIFGAIPSWKSDTPIKMDDPLETEFTNSCNREMVKQIEEMTCRICLTENPEAPISLFSHFEDQSVAQIMSYCTSLEVDLEDKLPKIVCDICFLKLRAAKELKETSITSDSILRQSVLKYCTINVKQEDDIGRAYESLSIKVEPMEMLTVESYQNEEIAEKAPTPAPPKKKKRKKNKSVNLKRLPKKIPVPMTTDESLLHECVDCGRKYDNLTWFENHRCKSNRRICSICNAKFEEKKEFSQHLRDVHFGDRECKKCNFTVRSAKALHYHMRAHQQKNSYMCDICSKVFHKPTLLKSHREMHTRHYECDVCGITLITRPSMVIHMSHIHINSEKRIKCSKCPSTFKRKGSLAIHHVRVHGAKSTISCPTCGKGFLSVAHVNKHVKESHLKIRSTEDSLPLKHKCPKCWKSFKFNSSLHKHMRNHELEHTITRKGLLLLKFVCTECPKKFPRGQMLKDHMRVHTGERPYQCLKCLMCFKTAKSLRVHLITIHKEVSPFVSTIPNISPGNFCKTPGVPS